MTERTETKPRHRSSPDHLNILFTCVGRRVELISAFRRAGRKLDIGLTIHGADVTRFAPAMHKVDQAHIVPRLDDPGYIDALLKVARASNIDMIFPLIDSELLAMTRAWERFDAIGTNLVISSEGVIRTCQDKVLTYEALKLAGIDTPETWTYEQALEKHHHDFPYFLKPREGSAGMGNYKINDLDELRVIGRRVSDAIVQEFVAGSEHTLDVYTGFDGIPRCVVPRKRLEVRTGEVSKAVIIKDPRVIAAGREVALMLGDCRGVVTVQCIESPDGRIRVLEINPRFGGGAPLAIHAGADFPLWLMSEQLRRPVTINPTGYQDRIAMLRYDESVFLSDEQS
jgi:carbamoyl-phosphate synthase large subunit